MPTIDQLPAAVSASDTDALVTSQNGILRKVRRSQVTAGLQPSLSVPSGALLGRNSSGTGQPETIWLGSNLALSGGTLSASTPLRSVDSVLPETYGALGDGHTDDTAAFNIALATGLPLRLGAKTYVINGQWTISAAASLLGVPGQTIIRRQSQTGNGAWILINGPSFRADGIIFDANRAAVPQESWCILVASTCQRSEFHQCTFCNAQGKSLGCGLTIQASDPAVTQHVVRACEAFGNTSHGIWIQAVDGVLLSNCRCHDNGGYGINADFNDVTFVQKVRLAQIVANEAWNNQRGISVGNFNATNQQPPTWGNANPDAVNVLVAGNICHDNALYGIAVAGQSLCVDGNLCSANGTRLNGGGGILANVSSSHVCNNTVSGTAQYGIDGGGSQDSDFSGNYITGHSSGLNIGGSVNVTAARNFLKDNVWAIIAYNVETDGTGGNFGLACSNLSIVDNSIAFSSSGGGGIYLVDAPQSVHVARNAFTGTGAAAMSQALWAHTDSVIVEGNTWNNMQRFICNPSTVALAGGGTQQQIQIPDFADAVMVTSAPSGVQSMLGLHQAAVQGQVTYVKVLTGGSGYSHASVTLAGLGSGASASAYVSNGSVIGITITAPGSGYGPIGSVVTVMLSGDGSGATGAAGVGLPVVEERRLAVACNTAVKFARTGSSPFQDNWTQGDITVPASATVQFVGTWGGWRAVAFIASDYVSPPGDGSLVVRTANAADLFLHPSGGGHVRIATDADPGGFVFTCGHGSPQGVVVAPPGSDYRNLDGTAGQTLWLKQSGTASSGWIAIA